MKIINEQKPPSQTPEEISALKLAQKCIENHPTIILGSGASVPHKIRGMEDLAKHLCDTIEPQEGEKRIWNKIKASLENGKGLEESLQGITIPPKLNQKILTSTWSAIANDDLCILESIFNGAESFPLSQLYEKLFQSNNKIINVITTNYDRIAEYASDLQGFIHDTGFPPGIIRKRDDNDTITMKVYRGKEIMRTVKIWKVHGSLDWFKNSENIVLSLPLTTILPSHHSPLIVTPGVDKYERTHSEPFRSTIQGADKALNSALAFLCIGYGFRDNHIQPKLVEKCMQKNVPIVVLTKALTIEAHKFLKENAGTSYLALESHEGGTRAFYQAAPNGVMLPGLDIWSFSSFNEFTF